MSLNLSFTCWANNFSIFAFEALRAYRSPSTIKNKRLKTTLTINKMLILIQQFNNLRQIKTCGISFSADNHFSNFSIISEQFDAFFFFLFNHGLFCFFNLIALRFGSPLPSFVLHVKNSPRGSCPEDFFPITVRILKFLLIGVSGGRFRANRVFSNIHTRATTANFFDFESCFFLHSYRRRLLVDVFNRWLRVELKVGWALLRNRWSLA